MTAPTSTSGETASPRAPLHVSYEQYLALDLEAGIAEWVDGALRRAREQ